jgi:hypothetical protein
MLCSQSSLRLVQPYQIGWNYPSVWRSEHGDVYNKGDVHVPHSLMDWLCNLHVCTWSKSYGKILHQQLPEKRTIPMNIWLDLGYIFNFNVPIIFQIWSKNTPRIRRVPVSDTRRCLTWHLWLHRIMSFFQIIIRVGVSVSMSCVRCPCFSDGFEPYIGQFVLVWAVAFWTCYLDIIWALNFNFLNYSLN